MSSLQIAKAIVETIDTHVNARLPLIENVSEGDSSLILQRYTPFFPGQTIALRDETKSQFLKIACVESGLVLCEPVTASFQAGSSYVVKTYGGQLVNVHLGNPETLSSYPAITIESTTMEREPFTLESVSDTYSYAVTVWADSTTFSDAHETLLTLTEATSLALYRELYPLAAPFVQTTLSEPTTSTDMSIRVESTQGLAGALIIEDDYGRHRLNRVTALDTDYNVVTLAFPVAASFEAGARVIRPLIQLYDPRVISVTYDDASDGNRLLKASTIHYSIKFHRPRDKRSVR